MSGSVINFLKSGKSMIAFFIVFGLFFFSMGKKNTGYTRIKITFYEIENPEILNDFSKHILLQKEDILSLQKDLGEPINQVAAVIEHNYSFGFYKQSIRFKRFKSLERFRNEVATIEKPIENFEEKFNIAKKEFDISTPNSEGKVVIFASVSTLKNSEELIPILKTFTGSFPLDLNKNELYGYKLYEKNINKKLIVCVIKSEQL